MSTLDVPYGFIKGMNLLGRSERTKNQGIKDDDPEATVYYFQQKFQELSSKISELSEVIENSNNKGSCLMKLWHLKELLPKHDGLGDYGALLTKLVANRRNYSGQ